MSRRIFRRIFRRIAAAAAVLAGLAAVAAPPASALEKHPARWSEPLGEPAWNAASSTCAVSYYNTCNGWVWVWDNFFHGERIGTVFESCCASDRDSGLDASWLFVEQAAGPAGWGYTGTVSVYAVDDDDCPIGSPLAEAAWLPEPGWNRLAWDGISIPERFAVVATFSDEFGFGSAVAVPSDGPLSCGICFPSTRQPHSFLWGTATTPLCPGSALDDQVCFVEWLARVDVECRQSSSVDDASWGRVKGLYR